MRAAVRLHHILQLAKCFGHTGPDVITECNRANQPLAARIKSLAASERRGHNGAAGMRLRWRMRVVGFIRMGKHAVDQCRLDRAAEQIGRSDSRGLFALAAARETDRDFAGGNCEPEIIAASVSRIICLDFSMTASGSL